MCSGIGEYCNDGAPETTCDPYQRCGLVLTTWRVAPWSTQSNSPYYCARCREKLDTLGSGYTWVGVMTTGFCSAGHQGQSFFPYHDICVAGAVGTTYCRFNTGTCQKCGRYRKDTSQSLYSR